MRTLFQSLVIALVGISSIPEAIAQEVAAVSPPAISGFDPVAYFTEGRPVKGRGDTVHIHEGTVYLFASVENRDLFAATPERYAPQYDGYCAHAVGQGKKVPGDPMAFAIVDDKLYFTVNEDILGDWLQDAADNILMADQKWLEVEYMPLTDLN